MAQDTTEMGGLPYSHHAEIGKEFAGRVFVIVTVVQRMGSEVTT
jgi:hypothetical protein